MKKIVFLLLAMVLFMPVVAFSQEKSAAELRPKAEQGDVESQIELGDCYLNGNGGVNYDCDEAIKWYSKAAEQNSGKATRNVGWCYKNKKKDPTEADKWFKKAFDLLLKEAEQGNDESVRQIGLMHNNGEGRERNLDKAVEWYTKAVEMGSSAAANNLGVLYKNSIKNYDKAEEWYTKAVEMGNSDAVFNLGYLYQNSIKNYDKAVEWYTKAAEMGSSAAAGNLGVLYKNELHNKDKAVEWYTKAVEMGSSNAAKNLGILYYDLHNNDKAVEWYTKAAQMGNSSAANNLGYIYKNELHNNDKAVEWYTKAVEMGFSGAARNLAVLYEEELNNIGKAVEWYTKAVEMGDSDAAQFLAEAKQKYKSVEGSLSAQTAEYDKKANAVASVANESVRNEKITVLTGKADPIGEAKRLTAGGHYVDKNIKLKVPISKVNLFGSGYDTNPSTCSATLEEMNFGVSGNTVLLILDATEGGQKAYMTWSWSGKDVHVAPGKDGGTDYLVIVRGNTRLALLGKMQGKWMVATLESDTGMKEFYKGMTRAEVEDVTRQLGLSQFKLSQKTNLYQVYSLYWVDLQKQYNIFGDYRFNMRNDKKYGDFYFNSAGKLIKWIIYM